jgi:hypothetical protein
MAKSFIRCGRCDLPVPPGGFNTGTFVPCPTCGRGTLVEAFPALAAPSESGSAGERLTDDAQASCSFHPRKKAVVACDVCGRFLCALCEVQVGRRHLCPACYRDEFTPTPGGGQLTRNSYTSYDNWAIALALIPAVVTPLAGLFVAIRHWRTRMSVLPRGHARHIAAIVLSAAQLFLWTWVFWEAWS